MAFIRQFISKHPQLTVWFALAVGMVLILIWVVRRVMKLLATWPDTYWTLTLSGLIFRFGIFVAGGRDIHRSIWHFCFVKIYWSSFTLVLTRRW